jgi:hypothetical protein
MIEVKYPTETKTFDTLKAAMEFLQEDLKNNRKCPSIILEDGKPVTPAFHIPNFIFNYKAE